MVGCGEGFGKGGRIVLPFLFAMNKINRIKKKLMRRKQSPSIVPADFVSSGCTLVNLLCTGQADKAFPKGHYVLLVGDSAAGKTWLSLNTLAEAHLNPAFSEYRLIYDNVEGGASMDVGFYFGSGFADRLEPPGFEDGVPVYSETVEQFYRTLDDLAKGDRPFIYVLDSMDALSSEQDLQKFQESKEGSNKGNFGLSKAKANSTNLRKVISDLRRTQSILIVIAQTRESIGFGSVFEPKTRAGGNALTFYAQIELWLSVRKKLKRTVRGKKREIGTLIQCKSRKNRIAPPMGSVDFSILYQLGIDDVKSCVDYLISEGHWTKRGNRINAPEWDFSGTEKALIQKIESEDLQPQLISIVQGVWDELRSAVYEKRKRRYE